MSELKSYTIKQLEKLFGKTGRTIYRYIDTGMLGVVTREKKGSYLIDPQRIEEFRKQDKKKKEPYPIKDWIHTQKYTKEEAAQEAQKRVDEMVDKWPDNMTDKSKKEQFGRFFRTYLKTHDFIRKEKPLSPEQRTEILALPLDLITLVTQELDHDEAEFFINQYLGYMDAGYDDATPTQKFLIRVLIEQQLRVRRFTRLTRLTRDYRDPDLEKSLDDALKRTFDLAKAVGEVREDDKSGEEKETDRSESEMRSDLREIK